MRAHAYGMFRLRRIEKGELYLPPEGDEEASQFFILLYDQPSIIYRGDLSMSSSGRPFAAPRPRPSKAFDPFALALFRHPVYTG